MTVVAQILQHFDPSIYVSLALLFGIAAQFRAMNGYAFLTAVLRSLQAKVGIVLGVVLVTSIFSPLILNDVVVLILTPVLIKYAKERGTDIAILVVAEITFTNIASSLTPLGNPQNILLWQESGISAVGFVSGTSLPVLLSGGIAAAMLFMLSRGVESQDVQSPSEAPSSPGIYLAAVAAIIFSFSLLGVSNLLSLGISFFFGFLFNYRTALKVAGGFDARSLVTLYGLVALVTVVAIVVEPFVGGYAARAASGVQPFSALFVGLLSSVISNVPTTQLLLSLGKVSPLAAPSIAVSAGLAGNIDPVASFANILALLMVRRAGLPIRRAVVLQLVVGIVAFIPSFL